ncbi:MAG: chorismate synthase [Phycisphaerae bacterium]|nr:chorismate synthase [Phycisphaerae bacterium]
MAGNSFGQLFRITTFGESHGLAVGVIIDGVPPGFDLDLAAIQTEMDRRRPGQSKVVTMRKEPDKVEIMSGMFEGKTTGTPLMMIVHNSNARPGDYDNIKDFFRPGHADYTYLKKYGIRDYRGGGRASARETVGRVAAGAVAKQLLARRGVRIVAYTLRAGGIACKQVDLDVIEKNPMRACDLEAAELMVTRVDEIRSQVDSIGGIIECRIMGVPVGLGEPVFDKLDADLAKAILSIPATKGIEFGTGFAAADMTGSQHNDPMTPDGFLSNNAGGILGGISNGNEIVFRTVIKPTSSIAHEQQTINTSGEPVTIRVTGRHDPCLCPRAVPVVEAMTALVLEDHFKRQESLGHSCYAPAG